MGEFSVVQDNSESVKREIMKKLRRGLKIVGMKAESYAKDLAPVDTGLLRNSIAFAVGGDMPTPQQYTDDEGNNSGEYVEAVPKDQDGELTLYIGTNVYYAPYQELGHHTTAGGWIPPQEFLRPAIMNHISEYEDVLKRESK